jgi:ABC-type dipeptide/oligopeptide/nickel transport system ATPase component
VLLLTHPAPAMHPVVAPPAPVLDVRGLRVATEGPQGTVLRGRVVAMTCQDPPAALNPGMAIAAQIAEGLGRSARGRSTPHSPTKRDMP